jgi:hypothetical protein
MDRGHSGTCRDKGFSIYRMGSPAILWPDRAVSPESMDGAGERLIQSLPERMNIALIIGTLRGGGAERHPLRHGEPLERQRPQGHPFDPDSREHDFYHLDPGIDRIGLNLTGRPGTSVQTSDCARSRYPSPGE